jgi:hypothetical protein
MLKFIDSPSIRIELSADLCAAGGTIEVESRTHREQHTASSRERENLMRVEHTRRRASGGRIAAITVTLN